MGQITKKVIKTVFVCLVTLMMLLSCLQLSGITAVNAAAGDIPDHSKTLTDNKDGTYTIELTVTGDADTETTTTVNKSNVVLVIDTSGSMANPATDEYNTYTYNASTYDSNTYYYGRTNSGTYVRLGRYNNQWYRTDNENYYYGTVYTPAVTRLDAAKAAACDLVDKLLANNKDETLNGVSLRDIVEISVVSFAGVRGNVNGVNHGVITTYSGSHTDGTAIKNWINALTQVGGTNWERALSTALTQANAYSSQTGETTSVIFLTDGMPTFYGNDSGTGQETADNVHSCWNNADDDARAIVNAGYTLYNIFAFGADSTGFNNDNNRTPSDYLKSLTNYAYRGTGTYANTESTDYTRKYFFDAKDTSALEAAFTAIINNISNTLGIAEVGIADGTTSHVSAGTGVAVDIIDTDPDSAKYWMEWNVNNDGTFDMTINNVTKTYTATQNGENVVISWLDGETAKTATYKGKVSGGKVKIQWESATDFYNVAPNDAEFTDDSVNWDLSGAGVLLDNVTYSYSFVVYPSQYTLDTIADLKNGTIEYDDLPGDVGDYIVDNGGGSYSFRTNTTATLSYNDTRTDDGPQSITFTPPTPQKADAQEMDLKKLWAGSYQRSDGTLEEQQPVIFTILRDNASAGTITLEYNEDPNLSYTGSIFIANGLMTVDKVNKVVSIKDPGHDYQLQEPTGLTYHWELDADILHPMIVNGNQEMLRRLENNEIPEEMGSDAYYTDGTNEYYKMGSYTYVSSGSNAALTATNIRRSNLNLTKAVQGKDAPADALFTFNITVNSANGLDGKPEDLWFSVQDADENTIYPIPGISNATEEAGGTGYYYVTSGTTFTVQMKAGWNLRFTNVLTGTTYTMEETTLPTGFEFVKVECNVDEEGTEKDPVVTGQSISGTVVQGDKSYIVTYTNKFEFATVSPEVTKVLSVPTGVTGPTDITGWYTFTLKPANGGSMRIAADEDVVTELNKITAAPYVYDGVTYTKISDTLYYYEATELTVKNPSATGGTGVFSKLLFDEAGEYSYIVTEAKSADKAADAAKITDDAEASSGKAITVTVSEAADGSLTATATSVTFTNKYEPEKISVVVKKIWKDDENRDNIRPQSVSVTLTGNNGYNSTQTLSSANSWTYTWESLLKYADYANEVAGNAIAYSLTETTTNVITGEDTPTTYAYKVEGNATEGFVVTNTHTPVVIEVKATKVWDDNNNQDGKRPATITLRLFAGDTEVADSAKQISKDATGEALTVTWDNLPKYDQGVEIEYTVKEDTVTGYSTTITGDMEDGFTVTNSYTPETASVKVTKVWEDNNNQDGKRETVTIQLYANDVAVEGKTLETAANESATFEGLPVYANGTKISYSVKETGAPAVYTTTISDPVTLTAGATTVPEITVTNSYTPATFQLEVDKVWADNNDQDGIRPSTATVQLYQKVGSGAETAVTGKSETVPYAGGEVVTWTLPVYENGQQITYSIQETLPENSGYTSSVSSPVVATEDPETTPVITVTNTHNPYTTKITITKTWDDKNDQDALRDGVVGTITLTRKYGTDGSENKGEVKLEAEATWTKNGNVWTVEIDNLPVNINGNPVTYSIDETLTTPNGYTIDSISDPVAAVTGDSGTLNVTNKHVPEVTTVTVVKNWVDNSDQDGKRASVGATVKLFRAVGDGDKTAVGDAVTVGTDNNSWAYTWEGLDKYEGGQPITYSVEESKNNEIYTTVITDPVLSTATERTITVTNTYTPETTNIKVVKVWNDNSDQDGIRKDVVASVQLYAQPEGGEKVAVAERTAPVPTANTSNELDVITFTGLPVYEDGKKITYSIEETITTAKGYELESISDPVVAVDSATGVITVTNKYTPETVKVTVIKVWDDKQNQDGKRPADLDVALLADNAETGKSVTLTPDTWTGSIEGLPKYKDHGTLITYTWSEEELPEGYELTKTEVDEATGYITTLTNSYKPEETTITVTKKWDDKEDQDGLRASVEATVTLYKTVGETTTAVDTVTVPYAGGTVKQWEKLPVYENGVKIVYSVVETLTVDKGYKTDTAEAVTVANGSTKEITNSYTPEVTTIEVTKKWDDNNDQDGKREGVVATVTLYKTVGETTTAIETVDVPYTDGVVKKWENLPVYEKVGQKITYTVKETLVTPNEYTTDTAEEVVVANGGTKEITNSYTPETTKLTVTKTWADSNDQDGVRKDVKATVQLYKTVGETKTAVGDPVEVGTEDDWSNTWNNLPVYENKTVIVYSVEETLSENTEYTKSGDEVTKTATKEDSGIIAITNTYVTKVVEISVEKVWDDNEDQDGFRPDSVTVILKADGETVRQVELTSEGEWKATVDKLPMYKAGVEIKYEFDELKIAEYDTEIENTAELVQTGKTYQFTVTNTHEPETTKITVTKLWDDANDQDGIRKNVGATVQLYKTVGETKTAVGEPVEVGTEDDWSHVFGVDEEGNTTLPVYEGGKKITYSVEETLPDGSKYTKSGDDVTKEAFKDESGTIEIKNSYTPELTTATVKKVWDDDNNNDGFRPEKLTVKLLADNKDTGKTVELTEENEWTATIEKLDKYRDHGVEIVYTWEEVDLPKGYELTNTATEGTVTTLTNTHNNELVEVPVEKVWKGDEDYDVRPESIEVKLKGTVTVDGKEEVVVTDTQELKEGEDGKWTYTWTKLNKRYNGVEIKYTVEEPAVPAGYKSVITGDATGGYTITNTFKPFSFDPPVIKVVDGDHELADPNETFTFKFEAIANEDGEVPPMPEGSEGNVKTITIPAGKGYEFGEVEITKVGKYTYEITEVNDGKAGYTYSDQKYTLVFDVDVNTDNELVCQLTINGEVVDYKNLEESPFEFVNIFRETVEVTVEKVWDDNNNADGKRPEEIEVTLYANDKKVETVKLNEENEWKYTFEDLPFSDDKFEEIQYTVKEDKVPEGYSMSHSQSGYAVTITNTKNPPETSDSSNLKLWATLMTLSMTSSVALAGVALKRRKEEEE